MDGAIKQATHQFQKLIFLCSKSLACNVEKNTTVEERKKRMNIANFINIYRNIYTFIACDKNDSK